MLFLNVGETQFKKNCSYIRLTKTQTYALRFTGSDEAAKGESFKIYMANNNIIFVQAASILFCYLTMES